ncbi:MAG: hypothetical protein C3F02_03770 [Parcubacteria group bacterium]|nr:MAG: hypothetical protein C3F02_03770 [Parcubacteria group bacterium]
MFEHLTPLARLRPRRQRTDLRAHGGVFLITLAAIALLFNLHRGPEAVAEPNDLNASLSAAAADIVLTAATPQAEVFKFVIKTEQSGVELRKLKVNVNGIYDPALFDGLHLFQGQTQLGQIDKYDDHGNIYFSIDHYVLARGLNQFSFILNNQDYVRAGQVIQLALPDKASVVLGYQGHIFYPQATYPVTGGTISFSGQSSLLAQNLPVPNKVIFAVGETADLARFQLLAPDESVELESLALSFESIGASNNLSADFQLYNDENLVGSATAEQGQISFEIIRPLTLVKDQPRQFIIRSAKLGAGVYQWHVSQAGGQGLISGQEVMLSDKLALNSVEIKPYYLEFMAATTDRRLIPGWNEVYNLQVRAHGGADLKIKRLTWSIDLTGLDVNGWEIWVNDKVYLVNLKLSDDRLMADLSLPIKIEAGQTADIKLLAKVKSMEKDAGLRVYLPGDDEPLGGKTSANIWWSAEEEQYNGYQLPDFPLAPAILTN